MNGMRLQLAASLKGIALDVQSSLPYEQRWDFSALVNALSYRFGSSSTSLARSQFHTAKRRTNEDVIDFANRLRGLLAEAEIMPTDWRHLLSTNKTNSDDEFDKDVLGLGVWF